MKIYAQEKILVGIDGLDCATGTGGSIAAELFQDCTRGALPPVGACYGLDLIVDDSIEEQPEVYFEGGDHGTLVHMSHAQFANLTASARHGCFSVHN
jgi:Ala-tRNA(Pro) deacylase